jgi:hypothetical protein
LAKDGEELEQMCRNIHPVWLQYQCIIHKEAESLDHVSLVFGDYDKNKPLSEQNDNILFYEPWLIPDKLFQANRLHELWLTPKFRLALLNVSEQDDKGCNPCKQNSSTSLSFPLDKFFIVEANDGMEKLVQEIQSRLDFQEIIRISCSDDEEERIALKERMALLKRGEPDNDFVGLLFKSSRKLKSAAIATIMDDTDTESTTVNSDEEEVIALHMHRP